MEAIKLIKESKMKFRLLPLYALFLTPLAHAGPEDFHSGSLIKEYGKVADVPAAPALPSDTEMRVVFDIADAAEQGQLNRKIESAARFLNLNHVAGVPAENMHVALVVHGPAYRDLLNDAAYGGPNANAGLIAALAENGVRIMLCGQTAAYRDAKPSQLIKGVEMAHSAMTAHAILQQEGYTLNPF